MRRAIALLFFICLTLSGKAVYADTEKLQILLQRNNCTACHLIDKRKYGPKLTEVAAKYANDAGAVKTTWDAIKAEERAGKADRKGQEPSVLDDVPIGLPALMRAEKLSKRAASVGFDWPDWRETMAKVLAGLNAGNHALAVEIAALPQGLRGFGHVRARNAAEVDQKETALLVRFQASETSLRVAAE